MQSTIVSIYLAFLLHFVLAYPDFFTCYVDLCLNFSFLIGRIRKRKIRTFIVVRGRKKCTCYRMVFRIQDQIKLKNMYVLLNKEVLWGRDRFKKFTYELCLWMPLSNFTWNTLATLKNQLPASIFQTSQKYFIYFYQFNPTL